MRLKNYSNHRVQKQGQPSNKRLRHGSLVFAEVVKSCAGMMALS